MYIGIGKPRLYVAKHECAQEEGALGLVEFAKQFRFLLTLTNLRLKLGSPSYTYRAEARWYVFGSFRRKFIN